MRRIFLLALLGATLVPASAHAATFCVKGPCPSGGQPYFTLPFALAAAKDNPGRDRIEIASGTLAATNSTVESGNQVDIVGAGQTSTTLQGGAGAGTALDIADPTSTVSDLRVRLATGSSHRGVSLNGGSATRVTVDGTTANNVTSSRGFFLANSSRVSDSAALLPNTQQNVGILSEPNAGQTVSLDNVELTGRNGLRQDAPGTVEARRLFVHDTELGVGAESSGTVNVRNSLIRVTGPSPTALYASAGSAPTLNARHVTAIGFGDSGAPGVSASALDGQTAIVNLRDSIVRGFNSSLEQTSFSGGTSAVNVSYSDFGAFQSTNIGTGTGSVVKGDGNVNADPLFTNAAGGDFSLLSTSPLIDAGDPVSPSVFAEPTDFAGNNRVDDGNGDGVARTEMGAYEYQRPLPTPAEPPVPQPPVQQPPVEQTPPAKDIDVPVFSNVAVTNSTFRVGAKSTAVSAAKKKRAPQGTTLKYKLSEAAKVKVAIQQRTTGARIKSKGKTVCAKRTRARRRAKRCDLYVAVRTLDRKGKAGANTLAFTGRIAGKALKPGNYRLTLTATDTAGNRSKPRTIAFRVVR